VQKQINLIAQGDQNIINKFVKSKVHKVRKVIKSIKYDDREVWRYY
jgi:hypothetical protein